MELIGRLTPKETLSGAIAPKQSLNGVITASIGHATYNGEYSVIPSDQTQIIPVEGLLMKQNITVEAVPQNYGRISWNGSALTVS